MFYETVWTSPTGQRCIKDHVSVWVVLFGLVVAAATIIIKIAIEFPGFLRFKCMYKEDHSNAEDDFDEVSNATIIELEQELVQNFKQ